MEFLNYKDFSKFLTETALPVNIGSYTVGYVQDRDIETIDRISRIAKSSSVKEEVINFLESINFPKRESQLLFDILSHSQDVNKVKDYLLNRDISLNSLVNKVSGAGSINQKLGISGEESLKFFNFSWRTSPPMGPGEAYLSTIIKDGRRPSSKEKGDCIIGNLELEIKGPGGRLVGQSGYGDAKSMRGSFRECILNISNNLGIQHTLIDNNQPGFWNVTKREGRGLEENLMAMSRKFGKFTKKEFGLISEEIVKAWTKYLLNLDVRKYSGVFSDCIGTDGKINLTLYNRNLLSMFFEYYHSMEGFHYFCMTHESGKFLIIKPSDFMKFYENGTIKIPNLPSFTDGAGSQGGSFAISL